MGACGCPSLLEHGLPLRLFPESALGCYDALHLAAAFVAGHRIRRPLALQGRPRSSIFNSSLIKR